MARRAGASHRIRAFTLIELLVVIGLVAGLSVLLFTGLDSGGKGNALRSAQASLAGIVTVARTNAVSSGQTCRVMINIDPTSVGTERRFLRYLVVQTEVLGAWQTIADLYLPNGVYIVPGDFADLPAGLFAEGVGAWTRVDGTTVLRSSALRENQISTEAINAPVAEKWVRFSIAGAGGTGQSGDLVLASGRDRAPGAYAPGESPVSLPNREQVCGLTLSAYGLAVLIADRASFLNRPPSMRRGFTLVEVVIAVGIFAGSIVVIISMLASLVKQSAGSTELLIAQRMPDAVHVELRRLLTVEGFGGLANGCPVMSSPLVNGRSLVATRDGLRLEELSSAAGNIAAGDRYFLVELWRFPDPPLQYDPNAFVLPLYARVSWPYQVQGMTGPSRLTDREQFTFTLALSR